MNDSDKSSPWVPEHDYKSEIQACPCRLRVCFFVKLQEFLNQTYQPFHLIKHCTNIRLTKIHYRNINKIAPNIWFRLDLEQDEVFCDPTVWLSMPETQQRDYWETVERAERPAWRQHENWVKNSQTSQTQTGRATSWAPLGAKTKILVDDDDESLLILLISKFPPFVTCLVQHFALLSSKM